MVLAARRRSLALLFLLVLVLLALTSSSSVEPGLYLGGSRILLPLPFAVWFLCFGVLDTAKRPRVQGPFRTSHCVVAIVVLASISLIATQVTFSSVATRSIGVTVTNPTLLSAHCRALTRVYRSTDAQLLATNNANVSYGCAAEDGLNTLIPNFDRRGWLIQANMQQPVQRILVAVPSCGYVESVAGHCTSEPAGVVLVQTPSVPAARTLDHINGMHVMYGMFIFY